MKSFTAAAVLLILALGVPTAFAQHSCRTVYQTAKDAGLTTLVAAIDAAGFKSTLNDPNLAVTVFAPTNAAFGDLLAALDISAGELLAQKKLVQNVLEYHVIGSPIRSKALAPLQTVDTLDLTGDGGAPVTIRKSQYNGNVKIFFGKNTVDGDSLDFAGVSKVVKANVIACKSVVHVVDTVLLP